MGFAAQHINIGLCSDVQQLAEQVSQAMDTLVEIVTSGLTAGDGIDITSGVVSARVDGITIVFSGGVMQAVGAGTYSAGVALGLSTGTFNVLVDGTTIGITFDNKLESLVTDTTYTAGDGLQLSGTVFSAKVDGVTIDVNGSGELVAAIVIYSAGDAIDLAGGEINVKVDEITIDIDGSNKLYAVEQIEYVAIIDDIAAATASKSGTRTTITPTSLTAKLMQVDGSNRWYYDTAATDDVILKWQEPTAITVSTGKFKIGVRYKGQLLGVGCNEYTLPDDPP